MVIFDPRKEESVVKTASHPGPRSQQVNWVDDETLIVTGFDKMAKRIVGVWDLRNSEQPLCVLPLGEGSGNPFSYYDREYKALFVYGRGDNYCDVYSFERGSSPMIQKLAHKVFGQSTQKAMTFAPKWVASTDQQEMFRVARAQSNKTLETLSIYLPSKSGGFN